MTIHKHWHKNFDMRRKKELVSSLSWFVHLVLPNHQHFINYNTPSLADSLGDGNANSFIVVEFSGRIIIYQETEKSRIYNYQKLRKWFSDFCLIQFNHSRLQLTWCIEGSKLWNRYGKLQKLDRTKDGTIAPCSFPLGISISMNSTRLSRRISQELKICLTMSCSVKWQLHWQESYCQ